MIWVIVIGIVSGMISGMGIGGGTILIPALLFFARYEPTTGARNQFNLFYSNSSNCTDNTYKK